MDHDVDLPHECPLGASFRGLGDLPGGNFSSKASAVSADGTVVAGRATGASGWEAFRWTNDEGMVALGLLPGGDYSEASGVSGDGTVVVGRTVYPGGGWAPPSSQAFRWTAASGMESLGHLAAGGFVIFATPPAVSADGSIVVGGDCSYLGTVAPCEAFRWTAADGLVGLGDIAGGAFYSEATDLSADGSVVVGIADVAPSSCDCIAGGTGTCTYWDAFRWTTGEGMTALDLPQAGCFGSFATGVSADGSVVVGRSVEAPVRAFRWTAEGGAVDLGDLPGGPVYSAATGVSGDGAVVVGWSKSAADEEAFVWHAAHGMRSLRDVLVGEYGVDVNGWTLTRALAVSDNGRAVVGYGDDPDGQREAWIATLPSETDCDANGILDDCEVWTDASVHIRLGAGSNVLPLAGHGVVPVALFGTVDFDVRDVDLSSVRLRRAGCAGNATEPDLGPHGSRAILVDIGTPCVGVTCSDSGRHPDGQVDLILAFRIDDLTESWQQANDPVGAAVELVMIGKRKDGTPFLGSDRVEWVPPPRSRR